MPVTLLLMDSNAQMTLCTTEELLKLDIHLEYAGGTTLASRTILGRRLNVPVVLILQPSLQTLSVAFSEHYKPPEDYSITQRALHTAANGNAMLADPSRMMGEDDAPALVIDQPPLSLASVLRRVGVANFGAKFAC